MNKSILIVGNAHDKHLVRFIRGLRLNDPSLSIDIFDISMRYISEIEGASLYDRVHIVTRHFPQFMYSIFGLSKLLKFIDLSESFKKIDTTYSIINIQFVTIQSYLLRFLFKGKGKYLITTPWGSDVYRINNSTKRKYSKVYDISDFVCAMQDTKFGDDTVDLFHVSKDKCLNLCFGSDVLDMIITDSTSKMEAKKKLLNNEDCYVITCGYNASPAQNHFQIVEALQKIRTCLPKNTLLVFPLTYAKHFEYLQELENKVKGLGLGYTFLTTYLTDQEMVLLRKCTDLFIHMQTTDAYSSSLHEYLYLKTKVINATWLSYKELEKWGLPYKLSTFETLPGDIVESIMTPEVDVSDDLVNYLSTYRWTYQINEWVKTFKNLN